MSEDIFSYERDSEEDSSATAEHVKLLIEDCKKMLISDVSLVHGAWGLIDANPQYVWFTLGFFVYFYYTIMINIYW